MTQKEKPLIRSQLVIVGLGILNIILFIAAIIKLFFFLWGQV